MFKDGNGILTNDRTTPPNRQYRRLSAHHTTWDSEPALGQLSGLFIHNHPFKCECTEKTVGSSAEGARLVVFWGEQRNLGAGAAALRAGRAGGRV